MHESLLLKEDLYSNGADPTTNNKIVKLVLKSKHVSLAKNAQVELQLPILLQKVYMYEVQTQTVDNENNFNGVAKTLSADTRESATSSEQVNSPPSPTILEVKNETDLLSKEAGDEARLTGYNKYGLLSLDEYQIIRSGEEHVLMKFFSDDDDSSDSENESGDITAVQKTTRKKEKKSQEDNINRIMEQLEINDYTADKNQKHTLLDRHKTHSYLNNLELKPHRSHQSHRQNTDSRFHHRRSVRNEFQPPFSSSQELSSPKHRQDEHQELIPKIQIKEKFCNHNTKEINELDDEFINTLDLNNNAEIDILSPTSTITTKIPSTSSLVNSLSNRTSKTICSVDEFPVKTLPNLSELDQLSAAIARSTCSKVSQSSENTQHYSRKQLHKTMSEVTQQDLLELNDPHDIDAELDLLVDTAVNDGKSSLFMNCQQSAFDVVPRPLGDKWFKQWQKQDLEQLPTSTHASISVTSNTHLYVEWNKTQNVEQLITPILSTFCYKSEHDNGFENEKSFDVIFGETYESRIQKPNEYVDDNFSKVSNCERNLFDHAKSNLNLNEKEVQNDDEEPSRSLIQFECINISSSTKNFDEKTIHSINFHKTHSLPSYIRSTSGAERGSLFKRLFKPHQTSSSTRSKRNEILALVNSIRAFVRDALQSCRKNLNLITMMLERLQTSSSTTTITPAIETPVSVLQQPEQQQAFKKVIMRKIRRPKIIKNIPEPPSSETMRKDGHVLYLKLIIKKTMISIRLKSLGFIWYSLICFIFQICSILDDFRTVRYYDSLNWSNKPNNILTISLTFLAVSLIGGPLCSIMNLIKMGNLVEDNLQFGLEYDTNQKRHRLAIPFVSLAEVQITLLLLLPKILLEAEEIKAQLKSEGFAFESDLDFLLGTADERINLYNQSSIPLYRSVTFSYYKPVVSCQLLYYFLVLCRLSYLYASAYWNSNKCYSILCNLHSLLVLTLCIFTVATFEVLYKNVTFLFSSVTLLHLSSLIQTPLILLICLFVGLLLILLTNHCLYYFGYILYEQSLIRLKNQLIRLSNLDDQYFTNQNRPLRRTLLFYLLYVFLSLLCFLLYIYHIIKMFQQGIYDLLLIIQLGLLLFYLLFSLSLFAFLTCTRVWHFQFSSSYKYQCWNHLNSQLGNDNGEQKPRSQSITSTSEQSSNNSRNNNNIDQIVYNRRPFSRSTNVEDKLFTINNSPYEYARAQRTVIIPTVNSSGLTVLDEDGIRLTSPLNSNNYSHSHSSTLINPYDNRTLTSNIDTTHHSSSTSSFICLNKDENNEQAIEQSKKLINVHEHVSTSVDDIDSGNHSSSTLSQQHQIIHHHRSLIHPDYQRIKTGVTTDTLLVMH
ncbi:unnamed protein product [Didymodactylos carnosus]|uniref:Uncharacterized protein n=1 Tax=Didymodactylos carnosus TaxID=1234261 RepID=A0A813TXV7_9BILA|nr:unnamed protein product [Didymodactylos carnosus]CAF3606478.1 unnamed protein product [Didymodactylos carnosus]